MCECVLRNGRSVCGPKDPHLKSLGHFNLGWLCDGAHGLCSRRLIEQMGVCAQALLLLCNVNLLQWHPKEVDIFCQRLEAALILAGGRRREPQCYHWV